MTDKEIIKALEDWVKNFEGKATDFITLNSALDLINRQQAEIEKLKDKYEVVYQPIAMVKAEAKVEAIKELVKKLLINLEYDYCSYSQNLVALIKDTEKEMVGAK